MLYPLDLTIKCINYRYVLHVHLSIFLYIQTPQAPLVRPYLYDVYNIDNYPLGTNAIVAVISYTVSTIAVIFI